MDYKWKKYTSPKKSLVEKFSQIGITTKNTSKKEYIPSSNVESINVNNESKKESDKADDFMFFVGFMDGMF